MQMINSLLIALVSVFLGLISIPLSFSALGIIYAILPIIVASNLFKNDATRKFAYPGLFLGGLGLMNTLLVIGMSIYTVIINGNSDPLHLRWTGVQVDEISMRTHDGRDISFHDFHGKRLIVAYWASWCGPCISEIPALNKLNLRKDVTVLGVSSENFELIRNARTKHSINYEVGNLKQENAVFAEITKLPTVLFFDRKGVIRDIIVGVHDYQFLNALASKEDYEGVISKSPKKVFDGVATLMDFYSTLLSRIGLIS